MGFLRRLFGRDFEASTVYTGRVLTADTTIDSGLKWASPLPTPASAGQVIKSTGAVEGGYGWYAETAFSLPTPSIAGQVLKATGTNVGDYAWGAIPSTSSAVAIPGTTSALINISSSIARVIVISPGGGGAGGGGARAGLDNSGNGGGGTGGGSGVYAVFTIRVSDPYIALGADIPAPGTGGGGGNGGNGVGGGGNGGPGGNGGSVSLIINGGVTITIYGGLGGKGGYGCVDGGVTTAAALGSGNPTVFVTNDVTNTPMYPGTHLTSGVCDVTLEYMANIGSDNGFGANTAPFNLYGSPGTSGGGTQGFGYKVAGGAFGPQGSGAYDNGHPGQDGYSGANSYGFGGGGGGGGISSAGGTAGGDGGDGAPGIVIAYGI